MMTATPTPEATYQTKRRRQWDAICMDRINKGRRTGGFYHSLLQRYYRFLIPPGLTVLELGCGQGDLLNVLAPEVGVGVDFSIPMIEQAKEKYPHLDFVCADVHQLTFSARFDIIILSDLVNDLWDVQSVLTEIRPLCHAGTRIIINFFNNVWRIPIELARKCHLAADMLEQNWLTPTDMFNLLRLSGYDPLSNRTRILLPVECPLLEAPANRFLINFLPFQWFGLTNYIVARPLSPPENRCHPLSPPVVSIIVPARNEAGNIPDLPQQTKLPGYDTELIFVEGGSTDGTEEAIRHAINEFSNQNIRFIKQPGQGKGNAVRTGFNQATGDILVILDADMTVSPECLPRFVEALVTGKGDFINGVRLVYPLEDHSMRFLNMLFNKAFGLLLSWLLDQPVKDTLCGTKALWKKDYEKMKQNPDGLSRMDPFGDFDLLFNAARNNLKIIDLPVRYRRRTYGTTKIKRWKHGWILLKLVFLAARRIKFR